jgi:hypothetical protein
MRHTAVLLGLALVVLAGCDSKSPPVPVPDQLTLATLPAGLQPGQTVEVQVTARDQNNRTVPGASISWTVTGGAVDPATSVTNDNGVAQTAWTLGTAGSQSLAARAGGKEAVLTVEVIVPCEPTGDRIALEPGESVVLTGSAARCNELTAGGRYLISVFNASTSAANVTAFTLRGTAAGASAEPALAALFADPAPSPLQRVDRATPAEAAHMRLLEANRRIAQELAGRVPDMTPALSRAIEPSVAPGEVRTFRIPNLDNSTEAYCDDYISVVARAAYVGQKAVVWEDTLSPLKGTIDAGWAQLGQEVDQVMIPILVDYFGDPLIYNTARSGNGLLFMLFSRQVNNMKAAVAGFVFSGDFLPRGQGQYPQGCPSSDETEIFYARVPTLPGSGYDGDATNSTVPNFMRSMRSTVIHEIKHLTSYARKIWNVYGTTAQPNFEENWLEEATARLSEEFYARALFGYGQGENVKYEDSVWCEVRVGVPGFPECDPYASIMLKHFFNLNSYLKAPEQLTPLGSTTPPGSTGPKDASFYGSGWSLVRWAMDHSGMTEVAFSKALVEEPSLRGVANLVARTGRPFPDMLADWTLSLAMDDHPLGIIPARAQLTHPSWDLRDIYRGFNTDFGRRNDLPFPTPWPLVPRSVAGRAFAVTVPGLRGGSGSFFDLSAPAGRQLVELQSAGGGVPAATLGLSIVRIQ